MPAADNMARWEAALGRVRFALALALAAQGLSFFLYSHPFWEDPPARYRSTFAVLCRDPFTHAPVGEPQTRQRVLAPLLAYAVGLRGTSGQIVLVAATYLFLVWFYLFVRRRWDCDAAVSLTLLVATSAVVVTTHTLPGYPDILAHLALLAMLTARSPWLVGPLTLLGMLADERCVAAVPLVAVWHVVIRTDPRPATAFVVRGAGAAASFAAWFGWYRWVQAEYVAGMTEYSNQAFLKEHLGGELAVYGATFLPAAAYYTFRSGWLFPAVFFARGGGSAGRWAAAGTATALAVALVPGAMVGDHARVMAISWPVVLIAAEVVRRDMSADAFRQLAAAGVALNVLSPFYDVFGFGFYLRMPLPAVLGYG